MIIAVNDYFVNDVINVKDGERQKRSTAFVVVKRKMYSLQRKDIFQV